MAKGEGKGANKKLEKCLILGSAQGNVSIVFKLRKESGVEICEEMYYYLMVTCKNELKPKKIERIKKILQARDDNEIKKLVTEGWQATKKLAVQSATEESRPAQKFLLRGAALPDDEETADAKTDAKLKKVRDRYEDLFRKALAKKWDKGAGVSLACPRCAFVKSGSVGDWLAAAQQLVDVKAAASETPDAPWEAFLRECEADERFTPRVDRPKDDDYDVLVALRGAANRCGRLLLRYEDAGISGAHGGWAFANSIWQSMRGKDCCAYDDLEKEDARKLKNCADRAGESLRMIRLWKRVPKRDMVESWQDAVLFVLHPFVRAALSYLSGVLAMCWCQGGSEKGLKVGVWARDAQGSSLKTMVPDAVAAVSLVGELNKSLGTGNRRPFAVAMLAAVDATKGLAYSCEEVYAQRKVVQEGGSAEDVAEYAELEGKFKQSLSDAKVKTDTVVKWDCEKGVNIWDGPYETFERLWTNVLNWATRFQNGEDPEAVTVEGEAAGAAGPSAGGQSEVVAPTSPTDVTGATAAGGSVAPNSDSMNNRSETADVAVSDDTWEKLIEQASRYTVFFDGTRRHGLKDADELNRFLDYLGMFTESFCPRVVQAEWLEQWSGWFKGNESGGYSTELAAKSYFDFLDSCEVPVLSAPKQGDRKEETKYEVYAAARAGMSVLEDYYKKLVVDGGCAVLDGRGKPVWLVATPEDHYRSQLANLWDPLKRQADVYKTYFERNCHGGLADDRDLQWLLGALRRFMGCLRSIHPDWLWWMELSQCLESADGVSASEESFVRHYFSFRKRCVLPTKPECISMGPKRGSRERYAECASAAAFEVALRALDNYYGRLMVNEGYAVWDKRGKLVWLSNEERRGYRANLENLWAPVVKVAGDMKGFFEQNCQGGLADDTDLQWLLGELRRFTGYLRSIHADWEWSNELDIQLVPLIGVDVSYPDYVREYFDFRKSYALPNDPDGDLGDSKAGTWERYAECASADAINVALETLDNYYRKRMVTGGSAVLNGAGDLVWLTSDRQTDGSPMSAVSQDAPPTDYSAAESESHGNRGGSQDSSSADEQSRHRSKKGHHRSGEHRHKSKKHHHKSGKHHDE